MTVEGEAFARLRSAFPRRSELDLLEKNLLESEGRIRILDRASPPSLAATIEAFCAGRRLDPLGLTSLPLAAPSREKREIDATLGALGKVASDLRVELMIERALGLRSEVDRAAALGSPHLIGLTRELLASLAPDLVEADVLASQWIGSGEQDDEARSEPLVSLEEAARAAVDSRKIPVRVVARAMSARAAAGPGTLFVQRCLTVPRSIAERVILHELEAHILPRLAALRGGAPLSIGPKDNEWDEEGFALTLEQSGGFLNARRRRELGLRHLVARRVLDQVAPEEIVTEICDLGESRPQAIRIWARAARGAGLCRELYYLIGFIRVSRALARCPRLSLWFRLGRMSVPAALRFDQA